ncbi:MAG: hypothetical protein R3200_17220, partial [Xanthomonadales bacterium]|nr:hypothetical protein [Xanthomonadales bacterium]
FSYPLRSGLSGFTRVEAQYVDDRFTTFVPQVALDFGSPVVLGDYGLMNLRTGIQRDPWRAELFVQNVFDEDVDIFCCRYSTETTIERPRTVGLRFVVGF